VVRLQQVLATDIKMNPIAAPKKLLPRSGWPQQEPLFDMLVKKPVRLVELELTEQSTKIWETNNAKKIEEMRWHQLLDYDEEEETEDQEADDVSSCDENSKSENNTSGDDT
jgi:hypothetical protein